MALCSASNTKPRKISADLSQSSRTCDSPSIGRTLIMSEALGGRGLLRAIPPHVLRPPMTPLTPQAPSTTKFSVVKPH